MRNNNKKQKPPRSGYPRKRGRGRTDVHNIRRQARGTAPTLVLSVSTLIYPTMAAGSNVLQVNIAPTISAFPRAEDQAKFYQQYRIRRISYDILTIKNVNAADDSLVYVYDVPINGNQIPTVSDVSYLAFNNVKVTTLDHQLPRRSFVPFAATNSSTQSAVLLIRAPKIQCAQINVVHFGHSLLFSRVSPTTSIYPIRIILRAQIQFYTFDGDRSVFLKNIPNHQLIQSMKNISFKQQEQSQKIQQYEKNQSSNQQPQLLYIKKNESPPKLNPIQLSDQIKMLLKLGGVQQNPGPILSGFQPSQQEEG